MWKSLAFSGIKGLVLPGLEASGSVTCVCIYIYICSRKGFLLVIGLSLNNSSGEACSLFVYVCGGKEGEGYGRLIILSLCWVGLSCFG